MAIRLQGVNYSIGQRHILTDAALELRVGEAVALIGPSGCGKSSLLKLCLGLESARSGTIDVLGESVSATDLCRLRRQIGYAVQGNGLFPHLTAADNISLVARLEQWTDAMIEARLNELCELFSLEREQLDRHPHSLSGGQQQRVGLARAIMLRPRLLLLDEPFAAIDPVTRADIHQQLERMREAEPVTLLLVTHDLSEAMRLAQRIVLMSAGQIHSQHESRDLRERAGQQSPDVLLAYLLGGTGA